MPALSCVQVGAWGADNGAAMMAATDHRVAPDGRFLAALDGQEGALWKLPCSDAAGPLLMGRLAPGDAGLAGCEWLPRPRPPGVLPPVAVSSDSAAPQTLVTLSRRAITFHQVPMRLIMQYVQAQITS